MRTMLARLPFAATLLICALAGHFLWPPLQRMAHRPAPVRHGVDNAAHVPAGLDAVLFGTARCHWCAKTRALLDALGVAYLEHRIDESRQARDLMLSIEDSGAVPLLLFADTRIVGFDEAAIRAAVRKHRNDAARRNDPMDRGSAQRP